MRGRVQSQSSLFSYVSLEDRVHKHHPLRRIKAFCDQALAKMDEELTALYKRDGRPSIPPEQLLKASLLQMLYGIRSERQLIEQISFNMLYRWFLDMSLDEEVWVPTVYSKNRDRLMTSEVARSFLARLLEQATRMGMVSSEHFSVDGTLIHAWASTKSVMRIEEEKDEKDDPPPSSPATEPQGKDILVDFRGETFSNATHRSRTDCDARLVRKSQAQPMRFSYLANALMENRSGLVVDGEVRIAAGDGGELGAARSMLYRMGGESRITLGADKGYDSFAFVEELQGIEVEPHIARNSSAYRRTAVPETVSASPSRAPREGGDSGRIRPAELASPPEASRPSADPRSLSAETPVAFAEMRTQADRGGLRLGQAERGDPAGQGARQGDGRRRDAPGLLGLQPRAHEHDRGEEMPGMRGAQRRRTPRFGRNAAGWVNDSSIGARSIIVDGSSMVTRLSER